jgi:hypothetical protein
MTARRPSDGARLHTRAGQEDNRDGIGSAPQSRQRALPALQAARAHLPVVHPGARALPALTLPFR